MRVRSKAGWLRPHFDDDDDDLLLEMAEDLPGLGDAKAEDEDPKPQRGQP
ncbi:hypothetical protein [Alicyclobacillus fructus]|nr:hypothetical protein [Alicyclobacillus fructus]